MFDRMQIRGTENLSIEDLLKLQQEKPEAFIRLLDDSELEYIAGGVIDTGA